MQVDVPIKADGSETDWDGVVEGRASQHIGIRPTSADELDQIILGNRDSIKSVRGRRIRTRIHAVADKSAETRREALNPDAQRGSDFHDHQAPVE